MEIKSPLIDPAMVVSQGTKSTSSASQKDNPEALRRNCQQFEAIFIQQLFKGMRATVPTEDLLNDGRSREIYQDLMDQRVAEEMARRQGLGIAEAMLRQLEKKER